MKLTRDQFERETQYRIAKHILTALLHKGLITDREFRRANVCLAEKYNPLWGHYPDVASR